MWMGSLSTLSEQHAAANPFFHVICGSEALGVPVALPPSEKGGINLKLSNFENFLLNR